MIKKVLLVYCNLPKEPLLPLSIGYLTAVLKELGVEVDLFDTTYYTKEDCNDQIAREESGQVETTIDYIRGRPYKYIWEDFVGRLNLFDPELVAFTCTEATHKIMEELVEYVPNKIKVVVGGPFATFYPQYFIEQVLADYVCIGDGEKVIRDIICGNKLYANNKICYDFVENLEDLPIPDFSLFPEDRWLRPMSGKLYKMVPIEISRGCLFACSYCSAPSYRKLFRGWHRLRSAYDIVEEMNTYKIVDKVEYFYLISESFGTDDVWLCDFMERYSNVGLPFWFNTRPEVINKMHIEELRGLKDVGCHRISMGVEHGNEEFRKGMLNRKYSNEDVLKAVYKINNAGIELSVNNMIGFPDETEELLRNTIAINRMIKADSHTVSVFQPYRGTKLYQHCIDNNYFPEWSVCGEQFNESVLDMPEPYLSSKMIEEYYFKFNNLIK